MKEKKRWLNLKTKPVCNSQVSSSYFVVTPKHTINTTSSKSFFICEKVKLSKRSLKIYISIRIFPVSLLPNNYSLHAQINIKVNFNKYLYHHKQKTIHSYPHTHAFLQNNKLLIRELIKSKQKQQYFLLVRTIVLLFLRF